MAILVEETRQVLVQGITGAAGRSFAENIISTGTNLVGGVRPGRGGEMVLGVPVFDSVTEAVRSTGATASVIVVPPSAMLGAAEEAMRAGIRLLVIYTEHVPVHDAVKMVAMAREARCRVVGPNSAGLLSPELANVSDMRTVPMIRGPVGVVSKSGTLSYELIAELASRGVGVSTVVCVGGDPVLGTTQAEVLQLFAADSETAVVVLLGEPGGQAEVEAGRLWCRLGARAPLVGLMVGKAAPPGRRLGHAGAIASNVGESAREKEDVLRQMGVHIVSDIASAAHTVAGLLVS